MTQHFDDMLHQTYPALNQLLISVLMGQYYPDRIAWAIGDFVESSGTEECANAIREIDASIDILSDKYNELANFVCYVLTSSDDARAFLTKLRQGLADKLNS